MYKTVTKQCMYGNKYDNPWRMYVDAFESNDLELSEAQIENEGKFQSIFIEDEE